MQVPETMIEMLDSSTKFDGEKQDFSSRENTFRFDDECHLEATHKVMRVPQGGYALTKHALSQFASKMGQVAFPRTSKSLPTDALMAWSTMFPAETAALLNRHLERRPDMYLRTYGTSARATLSTQYVDFPNTRLLQMVNDALPLAATSLGQVGDVQMGKAFCVVTPDYLHARISLANIMTDEGEYRLGVYLGNDEVGNGRLRVLPGIQRTSCQNSLAFDYDTGLSLVHRGIQSLNANIVAAAILNSFKIGMDNLNVLLKAREIEVPKIEDEITKLAKQYGWSLGIQNAVVFGTEGKGTLFGLVNGITYAAHEKVDNDENRIGMELLAGRLLMQKSGKRVEQAAPVPSYVARV